MADSETGEEWKACEECEEGQYSGAGATECMDCAAGKVRISK